MTARSPTDEVHMRSMSLALFSASLLFAVGCEKPAAKPVPPSGLAGAPKKAAPSPHAPKAPASAPSSPHGALTPGAPGAPVPPAHRTEAAAKAAPEKLGGTVEEFMNASSYTYVKVKPASGPAQWAAVLTVEGIAKGDQIGIAEQVVMNNFTSKTLNRTFDSIMFGNVVRHSKK